MDRTHPWLSFPRIVLTRTVWPYGQVYYSRHLHCIPIGGHSFCTLVRKTFWAGKDPREGAGGSIINSGGVIFEDLGLSLKPN